MGEVNIYGIVSVVLFYLLILAIGIYAAYKRKNHETDSEEVMLAGRDIGLFVGVFTMTGKKYLQYKSPYLFSGFGAFMEADETSLYYFDQTHF